MILTGQAHLPVLLVLSWIYGGLVGYKCGTIIQEKENWMVRYVDEGT